jgi:hypothetical protein
LSNLCLNYIVITTKWFFTGPRLIEYEEYLLAAKVFVCADMMKEAIDAFIAGDYWSKARKLSSELDSS